MNIGLIAMSGVRAHDPELLKLGLTLPGFVERSKTVASLPSLGLLYLAAATPERAGMSTERFSAWYFTQPELIQLLVLYGPPLLVSIVIGLALGGRLPHGVLRITAISEQ